MKNQLSFINSQELQKNNNINIINNESENNIDETTSLMDDKANKSNLLINDYNYLKSKYSEAESLINKLTMKIKELESKISILKRNKSKSELKELNDKENNINGCDNILFFLFWLLIFTL